MSKDDLIIIQNLLRKLGFEIAIISLNEEVFDKRGSKFRVIIAKNE